jgi:mismatch-specific thymine-DNA glycosylase
MSRGAAAAADDADWEARRLPDILAPGLDIVFVGFNPGRKSAARMHHFAGPNNHFWALLADAGLTPRRLTWEEDLLLPQYGLGVTNIVARPSRGSADLTWPELLAGSDELARKMAELRPALVCLLGKDVYRAYAHLAPSSSVAWGRQPHSRVPRVIDFVAPNPSSRSTIPYEERLAVMQELQGLRVEATAGNCGAEQDPRVSEIRG